MVNDIVSQEDGDSTDPRVKAISANQNIPTPPAPTGSPWGAAGESQSQGWNPYQSYPSSPYPQYTPYSPSSQPYPMSPPTNPWSSLPANDPSNPSAVPRESTLVVLNKARDADPSDIREVGVSQLELINRYHRSVLQQAQQSFHWALVAAGIGLVFYVASIGFLLLEQPVNISYASLISGTLVEVISGINFFLYSKASSSLSERTKQQS